MKRRDFIKLSAASGAHAAIGGMPGWANAQTAGELARGGTLVVASYPEPTSLFPANSVITNVVLFGSKINESLVRLDFDFKMTPMLAREWDISSDQLTWKFVLRDNARWHDGREFTSADVAFTMMKVWKGLHPRQMNSFRNVAAAETPDPRTVVFKLDAPIPFMQTALSAYDATVVARHIYEGTDILKNPANFKPVGTGPFVFKEWVRGSHLIAERNPGYWDAPKPYLDRLIFRVIPDAAGRAAAFENQEVHVGPQNPVPLIDMNRLAQLPYLSVGAQGSEYFSSMIYLQFNLKHPVLGKPEVRRALAHAVDQEFIVKNILFGRGSVATGVVSNSQKQAYTADVPRYPFNPAEAEKLLDQAGYPRGAGGTRFDLTLDAYTSSEHYVRIGEYLRQALNLIGVKTTLRTEDAAGWVRRLYTTYDYECSVFGVVLLADPTVGMQRFFHSGAIQKGTPFVNSSFYSNPRVDELFDLCQKEADPARRAGYWHELQRIVQEDLPVISIANQDYTNVVNRRVQNILVSPHSMFENFAGVSLARG